jgi:hypothetical protein
VFKARVLAGCVALVSIFTGASQLAPGNQVLLAATSTPAHELHLRLTTTQVLSPASTAALIAEASAIWKESRIVLRWLNADSTEDEASVLRVLVMARVVPTAGERSPLTVGELVRMEGPRALAIASVTGARRIVEESRFSFDDLPALHDRRLGVVLGRAVAHEIGHYLLQTNTHATQGLMRARIDVREFADLRNGSFRLDDVAQAHLDTLAARGTLSPTPTVGTFSYSGQH